MAVRLTAEQADCINSSGKIIVSASAGSGKTFVMIQKLIKLLLSGVEIEDVLAVTFTKKAAESMKDKLREAIIKALNESEDKEERAALKRKLNALPMANISTIHAFCSRLLKSYFYAVGISNSFEIISSDDAVGKALYDEAMSNVLSEGYESGDGEFDVLLKAFRSRRKNDGVVDAINTVYRELSTMPDAEDTVKSFSKFTERRFNKFVKGITAEWQDIASRFSLFLEAGMSIAPSDAPEDCEAVTKYIFECCDIIQNADNCFEINGAVFPDAPKKSTKGSRGKNKLSDEALSYRDFVNEVKDEMKGFLIKLQSEKFFSKEEELSMYLSSGDVARSLYKYALKFLGEYSRLKREKNKLDYNDLEIMTLRLLENEDIAREVKARFKYVFIDEYQDVNPIQEQILSKVSGDEVFLVGDKKQAIYSFRGSKSKFFTVKEREFEGGNKKLTSNFRSSRSVLKFVNEVFERSMTRSTCGISYKANPMRGGEKYGEYDGFVRVHKVKASDEPSEKTPINSVYDIGDINAELKAEPSPQAKKIYSIIKACTSEPSQDVKEENGGEAYHYYYDIEEPSENKLKRVKYGDIAILVRSVTGTEIRNTVSYLVSQGVPVTSFVKINICEYPEIKRLINILEYIDNSSADVPLCVALLSEVGKCSESDLINIKLYANEKFKDMEREQRSAIPFRREVEEYLNGNGDDLSERLKSFFKYAETLKDMSAIYSAREVLNFILSDSGMELNILSKDNGENCMERVERFILECANDNVHEFLKRLKTLSYRIDYVQRGNDNSVKLMTIHASKGLEYPVVILPNLKNIFFNEAKEDLILNNDYGFVPKYYDFENMKKAKTLFTRYTELILKREQIRDELNILYVALTRAKYAMHLLIGGGDKTPVIKSSLADFIPLSVQKEYEGILANFEGEESRSPIPTEDCESELLALKNAVNKEYAYSGSRSVAVKSSATTLMKKESEDEEFYALKHPFKAIFEGDGVDMNVNADVGTAYHAFLERANFNSGEDEYERMRTLLPKEQFELLNKNKCEQILSLPLFTSLKGARLFREKKFIVSFPADKFDSEVLSDDPVIYQGAIDLLVLDGRGAHIIDYKYSRRSKKDLREHYMTQIKLYKAAVAKILKIDERTVRATVLNIFRGEEIIMD